MGRPYFNPRDFHIGNRISSNLFLGKVFIIIWISWILCSPWRPVYSRPHITKENIPTIEAVATYRFCFERGTRFLGETWQSSTLRKQAWEKKYFLNIHPWPSSKFFPIKTCSVCLPEQPDFQLLHQGWGSGDQGGILQRNSISTSLNENPQGTWEVPACQSLSCYLPIPLPSQFFWLIILYRYGQVIFHSLLSLLLIQRGRKVLPRTHSPCIFSVSSPFVPQQLTTDSHLTDEDPEILTH